MAFGLPALPDAAWHRIVADATASAVARRYVVEWLTTRGAPRHIIDDLALAASELTANVVQHGDAPELYVRLDDRDPRCWTLDVAGGRTSLPAHLTDPSTWTVSSPQSAHGRGLGIVRSVVDEVEVLTEHDVTAIRCHRLRS
jgi:anti-sigma regulatory factor (Ser/Thr protein kinase)